jgi:hypothetical protein
MLVFNKYFYRKKKSKLYFGDRVAVLNDFIYQTGGSRVNIYLVLASRIQLATRTISEHTNLRTLIRSIKCGLMMKLIAQPKP